MEEDAEYAEMCQRHARQLGLERNVAFEGRVNVLEEMPKVDVVVLTSISEAQPLVILEAGAVGLPCVATDVGSCSELLFGRTPEDRTLGAGGILTPMATPGETARAVLELYHSPQLRERMRDAMRERVRRFYDQRDMVAAYDEIYQRHARQSPVQAVAEVEEAPEADTLPEKRVVAAVPLDLSHHEMPADLGPAPFQPVLAGDGEGIEPERLANEATALEHALFEARQIEDAESEADAEDHRPTRAAQAAQAAAEGGGEGRAVADAQASAKADESQTMTDIFHDPEPAPEPEHDPDPDPEPAPEPDPDDGPEEPATQTDVKTRGDF
jgi:hypothetical protein